MEKLVDFHLAIDTGVQNCEGTQKCQDLAKAGCLYTPLPGLLALRVMAAAIMVLLGDSSLPGMTQRRVSMVMVKLAPCAAMAVVMGLPRRDHGC